MSAIFLRGNKCQSYFRSDICQNIIGEIRFLISSSIATQEIHLFPRKRWHAKFKAYQVETLTDSYFRTAEQSKTPFFFISEINSKHENLTTHEIKLSSFNWLQASNRSRDTCHVTISQKNKLGHRNFSGSLYGVFWIKNKATLFPKKRLKKSYESLKYAMSVPFSTLSETISHE